MDVPIICLVYSCFRNCCFSEQILQTIVYILKKVLCILKKLKIMIQCIIWKKNEEKRFSSDLHVSNYVSTWWIKKKNCLPLELKSTFQVYVHEYNSSLFQKSPKKPSPKKGSRVEFTPKKSAGESEKASTPKSDKPATPVSARNKTSPNKTVCMDSQSW